MDLIEFSLGNTSITEDTQYAYGGVQGQTHEPKDDSC